MNPRILFLSLIEAPFEVMVTGEKDCEYRDATEWMTKRLYNKDGSKKEYDFVHFTNGYGPHRPQFIAEYKGFSRLDGYVGIMRFSNGLQVELKSGMYVIYLGAVGWKKNIKQKCKSCGCTQENCRQCIQKTGSPCRWVAEDLCSACEE